MDKEELIKNVDLFSGLKKNSLKTLAKTCTERTFKKGESLVEQGQPGLGLYIIISGKVKIVKGTAGGDEFEVAVQGPGDFIGEMSVFDHAPRSASVIAVEDTECLVLISWDFNSMMRSNPEIALEVLPVVVQRFRETNEKLLALSRL